MENEKLRILKMLENRQITAGEAAELLKAVGGGATAGPAKHSAGPVSGARPPETARGGEERYSSYAPNAGGPAPAPGASFGMEDIGKKFESFARDVGPKARKFTEAVADKISMAAGKMSDVFAPERDTEAARAPRQAAAGRPAPPAPKARAGELRQMSVELFVEKGAMNELDLSCLGGELRLKGYNGDKITAKITYRPNHAKAAIELAKLGGRHFLKYEPDDFSLVAVDAYVPEKAFGAVKLDGTNCEVDLSNLSADHVRVSNMNGPASISGISAGHFFAETSGARLSVSGITAARAKIENMNGPLEAVELDVSELKLSNYNAPLSLMVSKFERFGEYVWSVETGNAKLGMNLPTLHGVGYHIKAHAAMSEIRLGLTGLQFLVNEPSLVEARSTDFERARAKVRIAVETSNAPLTIN